MHETLFIGKKIVNLDSIESTNSYAAEELQKGKLPEGTIIRTLFQSKGKGYAASAWQSEPGKNLLFSVILYPVFLAPKQQFFLNEIASLAVADTLDSFIPKKKVRIKWPNDVFIGDKKVAGILIENSVKGPTIQHSILGIGMNVNQKKFDPFLKYATSIILETGEEMKLDELLAQLCSHLEKRYLQLKQEQMSRLVKDFMKKLYRVNQLTAFAAGNQKFRGKIVGISAEGKLVIEMNGAHEVFGFKEIEMVLE